MKKKFSAYFIEFTLITISIMIAFWVENYRENKKDREDAVDRPAFEQLLHDRRAAAGERLARADGQFVGPADDKVVRYVNRLADRGRTRIEGRMQYERRVLALRVRVRDQPL